MSVQGANQSFWLQGCTWDWGFIEPSLQLTEPEFIASNCSRELWGPSSVQIELTFSVFMRCLQPTQVSSQCQSPAVHVLDWMDFRLSRPAAFRLPTCFSMPGKVCRRELPHFCCAACTTTRAMSGTNRKLAHSQDAGTETIFQAVATNERCDLNSHRRMDGRMDGWMDA